VKAKILFAWLVLMVGPTAAPPHELRADMAAFVQEMSARHGFDEEELRRLLAHAELRPDIIASMSKPAEAKPWYRYRPIFVNSTRIQAGTEFWREHRAALARAEWTYGVPAEIIVAIIGVETRFGQNTGRFRVLDALATLAFDYPPRSHYFRSELEQFLLLTREEGLDPLGLTGSYAGAMGWAQFMPGSYRSYAVDFDQDGKRDLWHNPVDAIGSVAAYLAAHQWQGGGSVAVPADITGDKYKRLLEAGLAPRFSPQELRAHGVALQASPRSEPAGALLELETETGKEYWVAFQNFYVITRYNRSPLYAMAVYQLAQAIRDLRTQEESI
jgi:membrane-bound lytic murein transglycosylase B